MKKKDKSKKGERGLPGAIGPPVPIPRQHACVYCVNGLHERCDDSSLIFCNCWQVWHNSDIRTDIEYIPIIEKVLGTKE